MRATLQTAVVFPLASEVQRAGLEDVIFWIEASEHGRVKLHLVVLQFQERVRRTRVEAILISRNPPVNLAGALIFGFGFFRC